MKFRPVLPLLVFTALIALFGGPAARSAPLAAMQTVYLPFVVNPVLSDLSIDSLEITQAVQTSSNSVPLVANRQTLVRVFARASGGAPLGNVALILTGTRNGVALPPVNATPQPVSTAPSRAVFSSSFNVLLPDAWLSGDVALTAKIDSSNAVAESNEANNTATVNLAFHAVPVLKIKIVPIVYTHTPNGQTYAFASNTDTISDWIKRTYPVSAIDVAFHAPVPFVGDLANTDGSSWDQLLNTAADLKATENAPDAQGYYALVPTRNGSGSWLPTSGGFIAGIGAVGYRAAVSLDFGAGNEDTTGQVAAHEVGHNLGRLHAPCGAASGLDSSYPYSGASIGQYGVDIAKNVLWSPGATVDVMSYCDPVWVSDYTYNGLYNDQVASSQAAGVPEDGLLIRAAFGADGTPSIRPVYALAGVPSRLPASSDYTVELVDAAGALVASYPVAVQEQEQPHEYALVDGIPERRPSPLAVRGMAIETPPRAVRAFVPRPAVPIARVRLVHGGAVLADRALNLATNTQGVSAARDSSAIVLRWGQPSTAALVRYSADGGRSWTTLGVDVLGGALHVDPAALPGDGGRFEIVAADGLAPAAQVALIPSTMTP